MFSQLNRCLLCLGRATGQADCLCNGCLEDLPWLGPACQRCALPLPNSGLTCGQCQRRPPAFIRTVAPFLYSFPLDSLIPAFKYHSQLSYGRLLARLLTQAVLHHYQEHELNWPDALLPIPLHRARQAQRGYNQAFELARPLARQLKLPLDRTNLRRQRSTTSQQGLNAKTRQQNLQHAFVCQHPDRVIDQHLALIDDVVTTGTTANEAARTLLDAGAASITIWCVARTDR